MVSKDIFGVVSQHSCTLTDVAHSRILGGIRYFAPTKEAAELEGSKAFAKDFMNRHNIPTARYQNFNDLKAAKNHILEVQYPVLIKASSLATGKVVILPPSNDEALQALEDILVQRKFGAAGSSVVIEEYLKGQEINVLTLSDSNHTWSFPPGQNHKRAYDGDKGLNTGGMGVYAPTPFVTLSIMDEIKEINPTANFRRTPL
jgi:phosphoribosylamine--glycine ligase / phosphoribosylformylglycinamidine cyclo-ligase